MSDLRYPVGPFDRQGALHRRATAPPPSPTSPKPRLACAWPWLDSPTRQLDTPYRPDGWTVRQVVHHVVDSHVNAYLRTKFALSDDNPTIKPYPEAVWAEMADGRTAPVTLSLTLLDALHERLADRCCDRSSRRSGHGRWSIPSAGR